MGRSRKTSPTTIIFSAVGTTGTEGYSVIVVSATKELRGGGGLVSRLTGVCHVVSHRLPCSSHRILLILSTAAKRGTMGRTHRFVGTTRVANVILAGLSNATQNKIILAVGGRLKVPIGFVNINRRVSSLRPFGPETFTSNLFRGVSCGRRSRGSKVSRRSITPSKRVVRTSKSRRVKRASGSRRDNGSRSGGRRNGIGTSTSTTSRDKIRKLRRDRGSVRSTPSSTRRPGGGGRGGHFKFFGHRSWCRGAHQTSRGALTTQDWHASHQ